MLKAEQIPDEVFEAFQKAWAVTSTLSTKECLAAAINAWPGMHIHEWQRPWLGGMSGTDIILPLPTETRDDRKK